MASNPECRRGKRAYTADGLRPCSGCGVYKADKAFPAKGHRCRQCIKARNDVWRANNKPLLKAMSKRWHVNNPERVLAAANAWCAANREWKAFRTTLNRRGITLDQYHAMNENQDFLCGICGVERKLCIDHDHATGKVRGLLCVGCNSGLGAFHDKGLLQHADDYLQRHHSA